MMNSQSNRVFLSPPHLGDQELLFVHEAFASNYIAPLGPMVDLFEKEFAEYVGIPYCLALSSGTGAMHLALRESGVGPGDEVLASTLTFIGSVSSAFHLGGCATFIDSDIRTWNMDPDLLDEELHDRAKSGRLPKAVIPTDLYGQCADLPRILAVCRPYGIPVLSDSAEAMGALYNPFPAAGEELQGDTPEAVHTSRSTHDAAELKTNPSDRWRHAGVGARAAIFSFNGNKIITTSAGGMLASTDEGLIAHARKLSQQARELAPHYQHSEIGYNYRLSNILAALGRGQLKVLNQRVERKREIFESYKRLLADLPGIEFMPEAEYCRSNRWLTVILIDAILFGATRDQVRLALEQKNIESRPVWKPMHLQPVFKACRVRGGAVSERLFQNGLCLPSGTAMTDSALEQVASVIRSVSECQRTLRRQSKAAPRSGVCKQ
jgi:dTDP-4-amino-4,6-dideoxygalactose transaminase